MTAIEPKTDIHVAFGMGDLSRIYDPMSSKVCPIFMSGFMTGLFEPGYADAVVEKIRKEVMPTYDDENDWIFIFEGSAFHCHESDVGCKVYGKEDAGSAITVFRALLKEFPKAKFMVTTGTTQPITKEKKENGSINENEYLNTYAKFVSELCDKCETEGEGCMDVGDTAQCQKRAYILYDEGLRHLSRTRNEVEKCRFDARLTASALKPDKAIFDTVLSNHCFHSDDALNHALIILAAINATRPKYIFFFGGGWVNNLLEAFHIAYPLYQNLRDDEHDDDAHDELVPQYIFRVEWKNDTTPNKDELSEGYGDRLVNSKIKFDENSSPVIKKVLENGEDYELVSSPVLEFGFYNTPASPRSASPRSASPRSAPPRSASPRSASPRSAWSESREVNGMASSPVSAFGFYNRPVSRSASPSPVSDSYSQPHIASPTQGYVRHDDRIPFREDSLSPSPISFPGSPRSVSSHAQRIREDRRRN